MSNSARISFVKMHGAGNDFVVLDQRDLPAHPTLTPATIARLCDRRLGVGADGLIIIGAGRDGVSDFRMTYFNADGGEAEMCGNGARCSVAFAHARGLVHQNCSFDTQTGVLTGKVHGPEDITVSLSGWCGLDLDVPVPDSPWDRHCSCHTGVPHLVIPVPDVDKIDLQKWGPSLRRHQLFAPAGTNVNWVASDPATGEFLLRTYERGVEDETLACGTGASAAAVVMCHLKQAQSPVSVRTRGGDLLRITVEPDTGRLFLRGPACASFEGVVALARDEV